MDPFGAANKLLSLFSDECGVSLQTLQRFHAPAGTVLHEPGEDVAHVFFPEDGAVSLVAISGGHQMEVAQIGYEGVVGACLLDGTRHMRCRAVVTAAGTLLRMEAGRFRALVEGHAELRDVFVCYKEALAVQVEQAALAAGRFKLEQRLARLILMLQDRTGDEISITHHTLADRLGVRRAGITNALHVLEGKHHLRSTRGTVTIRNRTALVEIAGASYGQPESAYEDLMWPFGAEAGRDLPGTGTAAKSSDAVLPLAHSA